VVCRELIPGAGSIRVGEHPMAWLGGTAGEADARKSGANSLVGWEKQGHQVAGTSHPKKWLGHRIRKVGYHTLRTVMA